MGRDLVALVTGATSGIGEASARRLHDQGYRVFATGRRSEALELLASRGLCARRLDVTDETAVAVLMDEIVADHGGVDVLVNSAGFGLASPLEQVALSDVRSIFETNVFAMLRLAQSVLPGMRERGAGTIVNIGSTGGRFTTPGAGGYHMSKYSVEALSLALGAEVKPFGVRVVLIEPTGVRTGFSAAQLTASESPNEDDDPYREFKRRYDETTRALAENHLVTIDANAVARAVTRVINARNPKPRYIVGASGHATVLARRLLTDRMWDGIVTRRLRP
jgi:NADP-dependent 3-hydroxy acid dehydrogenase YdfG